MKSKVIYTFIFAIFSITSHGQNLVPNYSFETTLQCTQHCNQFNGYVADWTGQGAGGGLFYFTSQCAGDTAWPSGGVPYNYYFGFQNAHTGSSYAGIWTFANGYTDTIKPFTGNNYSNARNYIEATLTTSLKAGVIYFVTFYVNLQNASDYACNDIGAYFSDSAIALNNNNTTIGLVKSYLTPQIANNPKKQELTDTLNWQRISGSFMAKGGEKYIVIGNFKNDTVSSIRYLGQISPDGTQAYYYIDDVIVSPDSNYADSLESINQLAIKKVQLKVYPNPSTGIFTFNFSENTDKNIIAVYNMFGENIYNTQFNTTTTQIDLSGRPVGVYLYRVVNANGKAVASGKLIIQ